MRKQSRASRLIKLIMAFAIFWMVIGDLITYHQEAIYGVNFFDTHSPFSKPKSKDDVKTTHLHSVKHLDKQDGFDTFSFSALLQSTQLSEIVVSESFLYKLLLLNPSRTILFTRQLLRAPPTFLIS
jgi:hypothetical protein